MSKKRKSQTSRSSNDIYSRLSDPSDEDSRFKIKLGQSRKKLRKLQRKDAKRVKHQKKLEWIKRRKLNKNNNLNKDESSIVNLKKSDKLHNGNGLKSIYKGETYGRDYSDVKQKVRIDTGDDNKNQDELEIEYLEKQLLKNKRNNNGRRVDVLQELKSEFIRDGFDEDFLDFLSNITRIGEKEKVLDNDDLYEEDTTLVKHRSNAFPNEDNEDQEMDDEVIDSDLSDEEEDLEDQEQYDEYDNDNDDYNEEEEDELDEEDEEMESEQDDELEDENESVDEEDEEMESEQEEVELKKNNKNKRREKKEEVNLDSIDDIRRKQIGLVNRLSEGNYKIILNQVCEMYSNFITKANKGSNTKRLSIVLNELFGDLCDLIIRMIINEVNVVISLVATQSALICSLSNYFNSSILKIFLNKLFQILKMHLKLMNKSNVKKGSKGKLNGMNGNDGNRTNNTGNSSNICDIDNTNRNNNNNMANVGSNSKQVVRNIIISITSLYYYELIDIDIVFHLIRLLTINELSEDVLQLLLILLKYSGYDISKNSEIIRYLKELVEKYKQENGVVTNKLKYIEEEINSSSNSNKNKNKKSSNVFDQFDYLKNLINSKLNMNRIVVNLDMLLNYDADNIDGMNGNRTDRLDGTNVTNVTNGLDDINFIINGRNGMESNKKESKKDELIKKAIQIGLNKDIQKTLFICIMNSISPENAMNNILQVNLKSSQYNEVINIVIYCYLVEKEYNYYYIKLLLLLTSKLNINITKRYKKYINNNIVLYLKNFESLSQIQCLLLSKLIYHMIVNKIVRLRILNFVNVSCYGTNGFKTFVNELFGSLVTSSKDGDEGENEEMEEYLIQELLSIKSEKYFNDLRTLWSKFIEKHCLHETSKTNSTILFKSYQQVFTS